MMRFVTAAAALAIAGSATGQGTAEQFAGAQYPAPVSTFEIEAGHKYDYRPDGKSESYYRLGYRGAMLKSEGTPLKQATSLDLAAPVPTTGMGDRNQLVFRYEREKSTLSGGLFDAQGLQPMSIQAFDKLELRGTALVAGDVHGDTVQFAVGLETPPLRVPGLQKTQWSNWIVFGINGQRQETLDAPTGDAFFGVFTYRAFVGKAFGWRKSADVGKTAAKIREEFLKKAPDYAVAQKMADEIRKNTGPGKSPRTPLQQLFLDAVVEAENQANWEKTVSALAYGRTDAVTDQPTYAFYAETSGFYTDGKPFGGSKLKNLFTATFDYWFLPQRDDVFLRLRYENGFERATPTERKDQLLLSVGLKF
jgi:hypothetical protein